MKNHEKTPDFSKAGAKVLLFFDMCKKKARKMQKNCTLRGFLSEKPYFFRLKEAFFVDLAAFASTSSHFSRVSAATSVPFGNL